jgi:hypothetical protein
MTSTSMDVEKAPEKAAVDYVDNSSSSHDENLARHELSEKMTWQTKLAFIALCGQFNGSLPVFYI